MIYPKSFIDKVKATYPDWKRLHELLDNGSQFVGRMLYDSQSSGNISIARVLNAESLEELQSYARSEQTKSELYSEWLVIFEQYRKDYNARILDEIEIAHERGERLT